MVATVKKLERTIQHVWTEPRMQAEGEAPFPWPGTDVDEIDFDWWEPRPDAPWRRQVARDRQEFGGEFVASAKAPVEGPNNPDRLRRELEDAERRFDEAVNAEEEAVEAVRDASFEVASLRARLEEGEK